MIPLGFSAAFCPSSASIEAWYLPAALRVIVMLEMDGEADLVHVLTAYPLKLSISLLVNNLKSISSRRVRILNTNLRKVSNSRELWSRPCFACSAGGATIETLKVYVTSQKNLISSPYIPARLGKSLRQFLLKHYIRCLHRGLLYTHISDI